MAGLFQDLIFIFDEHITKVSTDDGDDVWTTSGTEMLVTASTSFFIASLQDGYQLDSATTTNGEVTIDAINNVIESYRSETEPCTITLTSKAIGGGGSMTKQVDLTTLTGWANLSDGIHQITIKAKADGYRDSQASSGVSVTKSSGATLEAGTYLINATPNINGLSIENQELSAKTYYLTANNTYSASEIDVNSIWVHNNLLYIFYGSSTYIPTPEKTTYSDGNGWRSNNQDLDYYTSTDTTKLRTIIIETDQTVSQEFYDWFTANATKSSTGETWVLNESISLPSVNFTVNFTSNNTQYKGIGLNIPELEYLVSSTQGDVVYTTKPATWYDEAYRTITFSTPPTGDLLTWLQANGTKQG